MIARPLHLRRLDTLLRQFPVVAILGARQIGKTTLARQLVSGRRGKVTVFDLEKSEHLAQLADPDLVLGSLRGLIVIDEIQRRPELFPTLRVLVDRPRAPRFLVLGSASPELLRQTSETLAGRIVYHRVGGLSLSEVGPRQLDRLWLRGGFPPAFTARSERASREWRESFLSTFVEREVQQLGFALPAASLARFWAMLAHWHGQLWNASELGRSLGVSDTTVRRWLDILSGTFVVRALPPFFANLAKRQIKAPKVYVADSGLLHAQLRIDSREELLRHPKVGASWEGFALEAVLSHVGARPNEAFFWATQGGAELDLLVVRGTRRHGFELKRADAPRLTPSMRAALADLRLDSLDVLYPGDATYRLTERARAVPLRRLLEDVRPLD